MIAITFNHTLLIFCYINRLFLKYSYKNDMFYNKISVYTHKFLVICISSSIKINSRLRLTFTLTRVQCCQAG